MIIYNTIAKADFKYSIMVLMKETSQKWKQLKCIFMAIPIYYKARS